MLELGAHRLDILTEWVRRHRCEVIAETQQVECGAPNRMRIAVQS